MAGVKQAANGLGGRDDVIDSDLAGLQRVEADNLGGGADSEQTVIVEGHAYREEGPVLVCP